MYYYITVVLNFQIINFNWKFVAFYIKNRKLQKYTWQNFELNCNGYICSLEFIPKKKENSSGHGSNTN